MSGSLWLFSSNIERDAAFPRGIPAGIRSAVTGVGLVDAGMTTVELVRQYEPSEIVYFGTCGVYPGGAMQVGQIVAAGGVVLGSGDTQRGEMRIPKLLPSRLQCSAELTGKITDGHENIPVVDVVCTLGITENDELAGTLAGLGDVENLELFSVLRAVGGVPVAALLGITNRVGEGGGSDWLANYRMMMAEVVETQLREIPGT